MSAGDFRLRLVGTSHRNPDGSDRQVELGRCEIGEPVELRREPDNPVDPQAVAVYSSRGVKLGYLGASRAGWISGKLARGYDVRAIIGSFTGGGLSNEPLTAILVINMSGANPQ